GLALVPNLAVGEQRLVARNAETFEVPVDVPRHVGLRDDRVHALQRPGLRSVEPRDRRVVVRRAERLHPERAPDADVVDVLRAAGDVADAVVAGETCADRFHAGLPLIATSGSPSVGVGTSSTDPTSPRDAAIT